MHATRAEHWADNINVVSVLGKNPACTHGSQDFVASQTCTNPSIRFTSKLSKLSWFLFILTVLFSLNRLYCNFPPTRVSLSFSIFLQPRAREAVLPLVSESGFDRSAQRPRPAVRGGQFVNQVPAYRPISKRRSVLPRKFEFCLCREG